MSQRSEEGVQDKMWDDEDNEFKPSLVISNRWQGEDEDLDVKDSWDEPEEEKKEDDDDAKATAATTKKPKKALLGKIEEKEKKRRDELERKKQEKSVDEMTPEELQAEKLRRQKLEEEADLVVAKELLGCANDFSNSSLDSKEDFEKFKDDIVKQLGESTKNLNFPNFVEVLVQSLCVHLSAADLKKIHTWIGNLQIEKLKIEKGDKSKKNKGKGKAKLKLEGDTAYNEFSAYTEDYDDFM